MFIIVCNENRLCLAYGVTSSTCSSNHASSLLLSSVVVTNKMIDHFICKINGYLVILCQLSCLFYVSSHIHAFLILCVSVRGNNLPDLFPDNPTLILFQLVIFFSNCIPEESVEQAFLFYPPTPPPSYFYQNSSVYKGTSVACNGVQGPAIN